MPTINLADISDFKAENPDYNKTIVSVYDSQDRLIKRIKFPSREKANEFIRECNEDFLVIEYGCN